MWWIDFYYFFFIFKVLLRNFILIFCFFLGKRGIASKLPSISVSSNYCLKRWKISVKGFQIPFSDNIIPQQRTSFILLPMPDYYSAILWGDSILIKIMLWSLPSHLTIWCPKNEWIEGRPAISSTSTFFSLYHTYAKE